MRLTGRCFSASCDYVRCQVHKNILTGVDQLQDPTVRQLTPQVMAAIQKISQEPEDHLDDETRGQLKELVHYLETMSS